ncbi:MAG: citramalate synthase [Candidatus Latescibacteria bacterium]|jgi:2-isopropylmalate synthase|nr:citramalate synthase [Candidatus Latescibacterota bacterium]
MEPITILDTTLRDGSQGENISFSVEDKLAIALKLDEFGIHYIEGGWPGSNPKDILFFKQARELELKNAKLVAFGSVRNRKNQTEQDPNIQSLLQAETPVVSLFGKSWLLHVKNALNALPEENLEMIYDSVAFLNSQGREVLYDAEHFFDGYEDNPEYALATLKAAERGGADTIILCDTNGGTLPERLGEVVKEIIGKLSTPVGIHTHNDSELAVANTLSALNNGAIHVQGTFNGYGERCGNANLCSIIPNLQLKMGIQCVAPEQLTNLTYLSDYIAEIANVSHRSDSAFVGRSAFAHKGGVHVHAVMKDSTTYEHIPPESLGNNRRVLVSDLSGKSNILYKAEELNVDLEKHKDKLPKIVKMLKKKEHEGYAYEAAEGSLELMIRQTAEEWIGYFELGGFRIMMEKEPKGFPRSEATIRLHVAGKTEHIAAEGNGPVAALDNALRKALYNFYPETDGIHLTDYKVRVLNQGGGTSAKVRVLINFRAGEFVWGTVGVSENIIEASWQALTDGYSYFLLKQGPNNRNGHSPDTIQPEAVVSK